jgi:sugar phosphate isomerase/epimerase
MHRRNFLKNTLWASGAAVVSAGLPRAFALASPRNRFKLGAISDGFSLDFEEALKIIKSFGLSYVEIRAVYGKYNTDISPDEIQKIKNLLNQYDCKCSVVDSAFFKCALPGVKAKDPKDAFSSEGQMDLLKRAALRAHAWGTDKVRGFTFWRVPDSQKYAGVISEQLHKAADVAKSEGVRIVIENEESCNVGTGHELAAMLKRTPHPNLGANWDVGNGMWRGEKSYPDGYDALDKSRIWHMHLKGVTCAGGKCEEAFADEGQNDLAGQFKALVRDHYQGTMSLECEFKAPGMDHQQTTKRSMEGLLRVLDKALA